MFGFGIKNIQRQLRPHKYSHDFSRSYLVEFGHSAPERREARAKITSIVRASLVGLTDVVLARADRFRSNLYTWDKGFPNKFSVMEEVTIAACNYNYTYMYM